MSAQTPESQTTEDFVKRLHHVQSHIDCALDDVIEGPEAILNHAQIALDTLGPLVADLRAAIAIAKAEGR